MSESLASTGSPFLRFNSRIGWPLAKPKPSSDFPIRDQALRLSYGTREAIPTGDAFGTFGGRTLPRGMAISSDGRVFLADTDNREILTMLANTADQKKLETADKRWPFAPLWPAKTPLPVNEHDLNDPATPPSDPFDLLGPTDVAITANGDLVILDPIASRLLVLAFPTSYIRHVITIPGGEPTAIAFDRHQRAYIADPKLQTIHRYDRHWRYDDTFQLIDHDTPERISSPIFIAAETNHPSPAEMAFNGSGCEPIPPATPIMYSIDREKIINAVYPDGSIKRLVDPQSILLTPQALKLQSDGTLHFFDPAFPLRDALTIRGLALTGDGRHIATNLPILSRPQLIDTPRNGHFTTLPLDSASRGFAWDRIVFDINMPSNTRVIVQTLTSESEIEQDKLNQQPDDSWSKPSVLLPENLPELLIQSRPGRYLWLRIEFSGDGSVSPTLNELDLFGPRRSGLSLLPAAFHQDPDSAYFLDRFLSYFDTVFNEITTSHKDLAVLFDPAATPADSGFLEWLGAWFDLEFMAEWDEATRRNMISEAISYFRKRGTVEGLRQIVQWHTGLKDPMPQIIEHFRITGAGNSDLLIGGQSIDVGDGTHGFTLVLPDSAASDATASQRLRALVAASIPAHCHFNIRTFLPGLTLGSQSSLGIDTLLSSTRSTGLGSDQLGFSFSTVQAAQRGVTNTVENTRFSALNGDQLC